MKHSILLLAAGLISMTALAQKFETQFLLGPHYAFNYCPNNTKNPTGGLSFSVFEYYSVKPALAIGTGISWSGNQYLLTKGYEGIVIPESDAYYESDLRTQSLDIPLILRYKTKHNWMFQAMCGLSYVVHTNPTVEYVYSEWTSNEEFRMKLPVDENEFNHSIRPFGQAGVSKGFNIHKIQMLAGVYVQSAFSSYTFSHPGVYHPETIHEYEVKPQEIGLKIGIGI